MAERLKANSKRVGHSPRGFESLYWSNGAGIMVDLFSGERINQSQSHFK